MEEYTIRCLIWPFFLLSTDFRTKAPLFLTTISEGAQEPYDCLSYGCIARREAECFPLYSFPLYYEAKRDRTRYMGLYSHIACTGLHHAEKLLLLHVQGYLVCLDWP